MKCKKCGNEVKAGDVYCPKCGAEIQIVPDYNVFDEDISSALKEERTVTVNEEKKPVDKKKRALLIVTAVIAVVAVIFGISVLITNNQKNKSFSYQYDRAAEYLENELPDKALEAIKKALAVDSDNENGLILLAKIQVALEQPEDAINTLLSVVDLYPDSFEAYNMLIDLYSEQGDYESIAELAKDVENDRILALFAGYVPTRPVFKTEPGTYDTNILLELQSDSTSQIYYTTDGSSPVTDGMVYTEEIKLEAGTTVVKAVSTNEFGIFSDVVEGTYQIELAIPDKPVVSLASGTYSESQTIMISVPEGCSAYYTWDGSTPNKGSTKYTGPFEILEGNNVLSVVIMNQNDQASDVARFNYIYYPVVEDVEEEE
ncbi:MAG: chitobiase/beta-hexosaminidase C-terminal domain-containing protein [Lachnospiraceae bacterium]